MYISPWSEKLVTRNDKRYNFLDTTVVTGDISILLWGVQKDLGDSNVLQLYIGEPKRSINYILSRKGIPIKTQVARYRTTEGHIRIEANSLLNNTMGRYCGFASFTYAYQSGKYSDSMSAIVDIYDLIPTFRVLQSIRKDKQLESRSYFYSFHDR